ncbi:hypothetical protein ACWF9G_11350 [Nocardia sp. NPDC055029]
MASALGAGVCGHTDNDADQIDRLADIISSSRRRIGDVTCLRRPRAD